MSWIYKKTCSLVFKGVGYESKKDFNEMVEDLFGDRTVPHFGKSRKLRCCVTWSRQFQCWQIDFPEGDYLHWKANMTMEYILHYFQHEAKDFDIEVEKIIEILAQIVQDGLGAKVPFLLFLSVAILVLI